MPPRKQQVEVAELRALIREHGIRFEGPVPRRNWPKRYAHHFQTIRDISRVWYDEYKADRTISRKRRSDFKKRANHLREMAYHLLDDVKTNEPTWRDFEPYVLQRFSEPVICHKCHHEVWRSDYEAVSLHHQAELNAKRLGRQVCLCGSTTLQLAGDDNDEESRTIFDFAKDQAVNHAPVDNLDHLSLSMKPDRVVGLRSAVRLPHDTGLFPVTGREIMLPFLVIEAKQEQDAPGFRAIQSQTAFVVRRLLMAQKELLDDIPSGEPCLVWFFAYRGEQWRLHVGTHDDSRAPVKIYDLWEGTMQRQDDALQLLLIVDYIWSWARDVYRPSVRKAVQQSFLSGRDMSPASTDRFRQSLSLSSAPTPGPEPDESDTMQIDDREADIVAGIVDYVPEAGNEETDQSGRSAVYPAYDHSFLQWAKGHEAAPAWTVSGSIRHSNIIQYEFQLFKGRYEDLEATITGFGSTSPVQSTFSLHSEQLLQLVALWSPSAQSLCHLNSPGSLRVSIIFYTRFDQCTWQIRRGLSCIIWQHFSSERMLADEGTLQEHLLGPYAEPTMNEFNDLKEAILDVQQVSGRTSVCCALWNTTMVLSRREDGLRWTSGNISYTNTLSFEAFTHENLVKHIAIPATPDRQAPSGSQLGQQSSSLPPELVLDDRNGDSMLIVRSNSWPEECPKFCLCVLRDEYPDNYERLRQLLEEARIKKNFYGDLGYKFSRADGKILRYWCKALKDGA
ncbi:hypothetical protein FB567DRAFT_530338 [Paraphoma chrysanthemicola]|uniref:Uncharacterized protein n=1 Tax=Paraphoma chrysanthemicola TaxID=798071 RepID=A0A8K0R230_9PLEO|nr:hypothetical protein FB567DRAFT_530338 [Paraphoma chrysanthemicola]